LDRLDDDDGDNIPSTAYTDEGTLSRTKLTDLQEKVAKQAIENVERRLIGRRK
jgi:hypothetical protein